MRERHVENREENWKNLADAAVQMLGHCRWWNASYVSCLMPSLILTSAQIPFFLNYLLLINKYLLNIEKLPSVTHLIFLIK